VGIIVLRALWLQCASFGENFESRHVQVQVQLQVRFVFGPNEYSTRVLQVLVQYSNISNRVNVFSFRLAGLELGTNTVLYLYKYSITVHKKNMKPNNDDYVLVLVVRTTSTMILHILVLE
jgi:hypothetical protein